MVRNAWERGDGGGSGTTAGTAAILASLATGVRRTPHKSSGKTTGAGSVASSIFGSGSKSSGSGYSGSSGSSGGYTKTASRSSARSSGGGGAVSSSKWTCPAGATLARESNGSGNLVCRWNHSGAEFQAIPVASAVTTPVTPVTPAPAPTVPAAPAAPAGSVAAPATTADWLETADEIFAATPEALLADMLKTKYGTNTNNQLYRQLEPYADSANALFLLANGLNADNGTGDAQIDWMQNYYNTLQTPGQRVNYDAMAQNLFAEPGDNPLGSYVTDGDSEEQSGNVMRLLSGLIEGKYSKVVASPMMKQLDLARKRYIGESARNPDIGNYLDYLRQNNPSLVQQLLS